MVDSFLDWRDKDDMHHLQGAEDEYYEPLGYLPKNGPFDSPEELLLLKGFDREALAGSDERPPLLSLVSTWGQRININTVEPEILEVLKVDPIDIESLITKRAAMNGLKKLPRWIDPNNGNTSTAFYRIEIKARMKESPQTVTVTAVVMRVEGEEGEELRTVYWKEGRETGRT
jgi:type II secretory pathway component PulK